MPSSKQVLAEIPDATEDAALAVAAQALIVELRYEGVDMSRVSKPAGLEFQERREFLGKEGQTLDVPEVRLYGIGAQIPAPTAATSESPACTPAHPAVCVAFQWLWLCV